jgi:alpha/beta superfamily hydrolase
VSVSARPIRITTADGHVLAGDLAEPAGPTGSPLGSAVVCHPHPLYGGDRFNVVVDALFHALSAAGFRTLRFDFRAAHGGGAAETADVVAALDALAAITDDADDADDGDGGDGGNAPPPFVVCGYSFGAAVALRTVDPRIAALVAVAPPLSTLPTGLAPAVPTLVLTPRHDQYCPPDVAAPIVATWPDAELEVVEAADHFLHGHADAVAARVTAWLTTRHGRR